MTKDDQAKLRAILTELGFVLYKSSPDYGDGAHSEYYHKPHEFGPALDMDRVWIAWARTSNV